MARELAAAGRVSPDGHTLRGGARVLMIDRYEVGERQTSACGIPTDWLTDGGIPNDPGAGSTAAVADGVATPNTPAGNMTGGKDLSKNIGVGE